MKPLFILIISILLFASCRSVDYEVGSLSEADSKEYHLDPNFYKKVTKVQDILIASSAEVSDHAHKETAYLFDKMIYYAKNFKGSPWEENVGKPENQEFYQWLEKVQKDFFDKKRAVN